MIPLSKTHLIRLVTAAVVLGILVPLPGVFLRSSAVQRKFRDALAKSTGMEVRYEKFLPSLLGSTRFENLTAKNALGDSLSAKQVAVDTSLARLLQGRVVIRNLEISDARFVRVEPSPGSSPNPAVATIRPLFPASTPEAPAPSQEGPHPSGSSQSAAKLFRTIRRVSVSNLTVDWLQASGRSRLQVGGIKLNFDSKDGSTGSGQVSVQQGVALETLPFSNLDANLKLAEGKLSVENLEAGSGGGRITAAASLELQPAGAFNARLQVREVDLDQVSQEVPSMKLSGIAAGQLELRGTLGDTATLGGAGELRVENGMFKGLGLVQMLGQVFQVQELANLKAREAKTTLRVADKKIWLEGLQIDGGDIQLSAPGWIDFDNNLSLEARLALPERMLQGKIAQSLVPRFSPPDSAGRRSLPFQISGTLDKPRTDLLDKLVGDNLGAVVGGVMEQVLGGFLKPRKTAKPAGKEGEEPPK